MPFATLSGAFGIVLTVVTPTAGQPPAGLLAVVTAYLIVVSIAIAAPDSAHPLLDSLANRSPQRVTPPNR